MNDSCESTFIIGDGDAGSGGFDGGDGIGDGIADVDDIQHGEVVFVIAGADGGMDGISGGGEEGEHFEEEVAFSAADGMDFEAFAPAEVEVIASFVMAEEGLPGFFAVGGVLTEDDAAPRFFEVCEDIVHTAEIGAVDPELLLMTAHEDVIDLRAELDEVMQDGEKAVPEGFGNDGFFCKGVIEHGTVDADDVGIGSEGIGIFVDIPRIASGSNGHQSAFLLKIADGGGIFRGDPAVIIGESAVDIGENEIAFIFIHNVRVTP